MQPISAIPFLIQSVTDSIDMCFVKGNREIIRNASFFRSAEYGKNPEPIAQGTITKIENVIERLAIFAAIGTIFTAAVFTTAILFAPIILKSLVISKIALVVTGLISQGASTLAFALMLIYNKKLAAFKNECMHLFVDNPNPVPTRSNGNGNGNGNGTPKPGETSHV